MFRIEFLTFLNRLGVIWAPESESQVSVLITPSPELLKVKLKTPFGPPLICISNGRSQQAEQLCCWNRQLKMYHLSETEGEVDDT